MTVYLSSTTKLSSYASALEVWPHCATSHELSDSWQCAHLSPSLSRRLSVCRGEEASFWLLAAWPKQTKAKVCFFSSPQAGSRLSWQLKESRKSLGAVYSSNALMIITQNLLMKAVQVRAYKRIKMNEWIRKVGRPGQTQASRPQHGLLSILKRKKKSLPVCSTQIGLASFRTCPPTVSPCITPFRCLGSTTPCHGLKAWMQLAARAD